LLLLDLFRRAKVEGVEVERKLSLNRVKSPHENFKGVALFEFLSLDKRLR